MTTKTRRQVPDHQEEAPFAYEGLDRIIHERARLGILTSLITHPKGLTFNHLKQLCALTDGNLSRHLRVLEEEKIVEIAKGYDNNRPQTLCCITASGHKRYMGYLTALEQVVRDAARVQKGAVQKGTTQKETTSSRSLRGLTPSKA